MLKTETGHSSYTEYLDAYRARHPYLRRLQDQLSRARSHHGVDNEPTFAIIDRFNDDHSRIRVVLRFDSNKESATK